MAATPLTDRARRLRTQQTKAEGRLWRELKNRQLGGWKWKRQAPRGPYIVDFLCADASLAVELDGGQHADQVEYDERREAWLARDGLRVLRFWNNDVIENLTGTCDSILAACGGEAPSPSQPLRGRAPPSPPLSRGRGLKELAGVSARIGSERLLVQGPGGNTSLKLGDEMWVKGSGVWLAEASERQIFTCVSLEKVRQRLAAGEAENLSDTVLPQGDPSLRPSIETSLHALMPHPAVVHAHAVGAMTVSVLADGEARAAAALSGHVQWAWVPYRRPGTPLAGLIAEILASRPVDVLILENHGVVVGADSPAQAEALLRDIERRLIFPLRGLQPPSVDLLRSIETADYEALPEVSGVALDDELTAALIAAPLFPDQVVFVGGAAPELGKTESLQAAAERVRGDTGILPALVIAPGVGVFARRTRTRAADSVIRGLMDVAVRLPRGARVRGLPDGAIPALLNWDAEAYRIKLAGGGA